MKTVIKINSILSISLLLFNTLVVFGQNKGAVSISENEVIPYESAMLEVISSEKGIVIPRMTLGQRNAIQEASDGLMVYVNDAFPNKGYWYWDASQSVWQKFRISTPQDKDLRAPLGSVVMYNGSFDDFDESGLGLPATELDGWAICNGNNKTPDLRSMFLVGGHKDSISYQTMGTQGGYDKVKLTKEHLPEHNHGTDDSKLQAKIDSHIHEIYDPGHTHSFKTDNGTKGEYADKGGRKGKKEVDGKTKNSNVTVSVSSTASGLAEVNIPKNYLKNYPDTDASEFDNRPKYFVVVYIIRTDLKADYSSGGIFPY